MENRTSQMFLFSKLETKHVQSNRQKHAYDEIENTINILSQVHTDKKEIQLIYSFPDKFFNFDKGCFDNSNIFISTLDSFPDIFLYASFISFFTKDSPQVKEELVLRSDETIISSFEIPLSPYLFICFIYNFIDIMKIEESPDKSNIIIEQKIAQCLLQHSTELVLLKNFRELYNELFKIIENTLTKDKKPFTTDYKKEFLYFFKTAFYRTISFPSNLKESFNDTMKELFKYDESNLEFQDIITYYNFLLHQPNDNFKEYAKKAVIEIIGQGRQPIKNLHVKLIFDTKKELENFEVHFNYNSNVYKRKVINGSVECVFPYFQGISLHISIFDLKKVIIKDYVIPSDNENGTIKYKSVFITINHEFLNIDTSFNIIKDDKSEEIFDYVMHKFFQKYLSLNKCLYSFDNNVSNAHNMPKRPFPINYWLILIDIAIKYSYSPNFFFSEMAKMIYKYFISAQEYLDLLCLVLYNYFYYIKLSNPDENKENIFNFLEGLEGNIFQTLARQMAKPEEFPKLSITSLLLIFNLLKNNEEMNDQCITVEKSSIKNIEQSIIDDVLFADKQNLDQYRTNFLKSYINYKTKKEDNIIEGCDSFLSSIDIESLKTIVRKLLYRCNSLSIFNILSFYPGFENYKNQILEVFKTIVLFIYGILNKITLQNTDIVEFILQYNELAKKIDYSLNTNIFFDSLLQKLVFSLINDHEIIIFKEIDNDNFNVNSNKYRTSISLNDLITFFNDSFKFLNQLKIPPEYGKKYYIIYISLNSAFCNFYTECLISIVSNQFREKFGKRYPHWCIDLDAFKNKDITLKNIIVIINNLSIIQNYWIEYLQKHEEYFQNDPTFLSNTKRAKEFKNKTTNNDKSSNNNNDDNNNDNKNIGNEYILNDPFAHKDMLQYTKYIFNFMRLKISNDIINHLKNKVYDGKNINIEFFKNINLEFEEILPMCQDTIRIVFETLRPSLEAIGLQQLMRSFEDGIFECMIPLAFSSQTSIKIIENKTIFDIFITEIMIFKNAIIEEVGNIGFNNDLKEVCKNSFRLLSYVNKLTTTHHFDLNDELAKEEKELKGDYSKIIILKMLIQSRNENIPWFFKNQSIDPKYTFISLE